MSSPATFDDQALADAVFRNCAMARTRFENVSLADAQIEDVDLRGASFRNVNMADVSIDDANITGLMISGYDVEALIQHFEASGSPTTTLSDGKMMVAEPQLFVSDLDRARRFYVEKLGFCVTLSFGEPPFYTQVSRGGWKLNLRQVEGLVFDRGFRDREEDALSATLTLNDPGPIFREYQTAGIEFHQPLKAETWGARTFIVRDPDGNLIAIAGTAK